MIWIVLRGIPQVADFHSSAQSDSLFLSGFLLNQLLEYENREITDFCLCNMIYDVIYLERRRDFF